MKNKGLVHIYTGEGKGKTTAAIGLATRAVGGGLKVCYVSFHKRPEKYGYTEMDSLRNLGVVVMNFVKGGRPRLNRSTDSQSIAEEAKRALQTISELIVNQNFDLLIMDEVIITVGSNYISEEEFIKFVQNKPEHTELVLTGRGATPNLIEQADYVSHIQKIKHPFDKGTPSRKGIEY